jgi:hypothetical protein
MHSTPHHHLMEVIGQCHTPDNILTAGRAPGTQWVSCVSPGVAWDGVQTRKISTTIGNWTLIPQSTDLQPKYYTDRAILAPVTGKLLLCLDTLIPDLPNTAQSCSQHCPATAWLYLFKKDFTPFFNAMFDCHFNNLFLFAMNYFVRIFLHSTLLHCLTANEESCKLYNHVFGMETVEDVCTVLHLLPACIFTPHAKRDRANCREV